jgi:hypothetical protein
VPEVLDGVHDQRSHPGSMIGPDRRSACRCEEASVAGMNRNLLRRLPYTLAALVFALLVLAAAVFLDIDVLELPGLTIPGIDPGEMGEIIIAFLLVVPAFLVDYLVTRQRTHETQLLAEQLRVLRVTMRTVQDIVNNNLNQLQLLRFEAEGRVSQDTLTLFDDALRATAAELTALGNMEAFAERPMVSGAGLDAGPSAPR